VIIDAHAHALDEAFLAGLCRKPAFGLAAERGKDNRFWIRRGDGRSHSIDENLFDVPKRVDSLARRGCVWRPSGDQASPQRCTAIGRRRRAD